jgi:hypothetical protein
MTIDDTHSAVLGTGPTPEEREARLEAGGAKLATGNGPTSILLGGRLLIVIAGSLMTAGLTAILLGWFGASRSILVVKQIPYLISGGLLGVALATVGGLTFFAHWLAVLVQEIRAGKADRQREHEELVRAIREERAADHQQLIDAIRDLGLGGSAQEKANGRARSTADRRPIRRASGGK